MFRKESFKNSSFFTPLSEKGNVTACLRGQAAWPGKKSIVPFEKTRQMVKYLKQDKDKDRVEERKYFLSLGKKSILCLYKGNEWRL